jgi:hypothetical protein
MYHTESNFIPMPFFKAQLLIAAPPDLTLKNDVLCSQGVCVYSLWFSQ